MEFEALPAAAVAQVVRQTCKRGFVLAWKERCSKQSLFYSVQTELAQALLQREARLELGEQILLELGEQILQARAQALSPLEELHGVDPRAGAA